MEPQKEKRWNWIGVPEMFNLNQACQLLSEAFGFGTVFQVGSSLERRDFRDVDIRVMLSDQEYDRLFPGQQGPPQLDARWALMSVAISEWLKSRTGLPIDFQIQKSSEANEQYPGARNAVGIYMARKPEPA